MKKSIKASIAQTTITMKFEGVTIYIKREENVILFEESKEVIKKGSLEEIEAMFKSVKAKLEKYTNKIFEVEGDEIFIKGDDTPIPELLADKLIALEAANEDFMPLVRFWKKLRTNPSKASIEQLYGFLVHNNIPITETGDIVTEKGVNQKRGGLPEELVDCRTSSIDNSIGMEVIMDRSKVDEDPTVTCSHGLHVGAAEYVRNWYSNNIIVVCTVNPRDVVAVPTDYKNTKMRVCRYIVSGYSDKTKKDKLIFKLSDFLQSPLKEDVEKMKSISKESPTTRNNKDEVVSKKARKSKTTIPKKYINKATKKVNGLSASKIVALVEKETGVVFTYSLKSKSTIVRNAVKVLSNHYETTS